MIVIEVQGQNFEGMVGPFPKREDAEQWLEDKKPWTGSADFHTEIHHPDDVGAL